jgi:hypothetical protein
MKSKRNDFEYIFFLEIIKLFEVVEEGLFIAYEIIALEMIVDSLAMKIRNSTFEEVLLKVFQTI